MIQINHTSGEQNYPRRTAPRSIVREFAKFMSSLRRSQQLFVICVIVATIAFIGVLSIAGEVYLVRQMASSTEVPSETTFSKYVAILVIFLSIPLVSTSMLSYLGNVGSTRYPMIIDELVSEVGRLRKELVNSRHNLSAEEKSDLIERLQLTVTTEFKEELLFELEKKHSQASIELAHLNIARSVFDDTRGRLLEEIEALGRRGNLSLVLGTVASGAGIFLLATTLFLAKPPEVGNPSLLQIYVPRIALALIIQILAFFFLKLYRSGLETIKYFQNELTNVEIKYIALTTAVMLKNEKSTAALVNQLSKTERNFLLQKGQTTVELQKIRLENSNNEDLVMLLTKALQSKVLTQSSQNSL